LLNEYFTVSDVAALSVRFHRFSVSGFCHGGTGEQEPKKELKDTAVGAAILFRQSVYRNRCWMHEEDWQFAWEHAGITV
jgi:hypothetical protein